jgi:hypothetical protein
MRNSLDCPHVSPQNLLNDFRRNLIVEGLHKQLASGFLFVPYRPMLSLCCKNLKSNLNGFRKDGSP